MKRRLTPSAGQFLPELSMLAELAVESAASLRVRLADRIDHAAAGDDLCAGERAAYELALTVMADAPRALVPPIDGDDATELAWRLHGVVDAIRRAAAVDASLRPMLPDVGVTQLIDLLVEAVDSLEGAAATVTDKSRALSFASDARRIGRQGDRVYVDAMVGVLLSKMPDPLRALRQAEIYRTLREGLRACERAAASVERIALKQFVA
jgi:uncharacterized protein Yka (UPF0111/DUF47 family)